MTQTSVAPTTPLVAPILILPDGQEVQTSNDPWEVKDLGFSNSVRFDFRDLVGLQGDSLNRLKYTIAYILETRSVAHAMNLFFRFRAFHSAVLSGSRSAPVRQIELAHLLNWRAQLTEERMWQLGAIRILLEKAESLHVGFCSVEAMQWLAESIIPGNPKGTDVRTRDPNRGPFTAGEVAALNSALNDAYRGGDIDISDYAAGHVLLAFGVRSRQLAALKEKDLVIAETREAEKRYVLSIPQAKQRGELTRDSFRLRPCDRRLGQLLELLIQENRSRKSDPRVAEDNWPMFIGPDRGANPPGFEYHRSAQDIVQRIRSLIEVRAKIRANSKRFRHTLAQNMADDGASKYEIAEALGHTDTQQVGKYIEARPEMVARLNHIAEDFVPILQAFAGILVSSKDSAAATAPRGKRLHDRALESGGDRPLGHCEQHSFCDLAKPIGCYTCASFRPWDDGPHEEMLAKLKAERQRKTERGLSPKIYTINDRTIAAVSEVVRLCRQHRAAVHPGSS